MLIINLLRSLCRVIPLFHFSSIVYFLYFPHAEISGGAEVAVQVADVVKVGLIGYVCFQTFSHESFHAFQAAHDQHVVIQRFILVLSQLFKQSFTGLVFAFINFFFYLLFDGLDSFNDLYDFCEFLVSLGLQLQAQQKWIRAGKLILFLEVYLYLQPLQFAEEMDEQDITRCLLFLIRKYRLLQLIEQVLYDGDGFAIITIPYLAILHFDEFGDQVEHGQLAAAFQVDQEQLHMLELGRFSLGNLVALFVRSAIKHGLANCLLGVLAGLFLFQEVVQLHESFIELAFAITEGKIMLVFFDTILLSVGSQSLVNFRPSKGPDYDLLAEKGAIDSHQLILLTIIMRGGAEVND